MKSVMYAVNGDQTVAKPYGASEVYIVNGDTSVPKPAGVSEVYALNGDTSVEKPKGVSEIWLDSDDTANAPAGVSVVSIPNYSGSGPEPILLPEKTIRCKFAAGYTPTMGDTQTLVDAEENIWDIYKSSSEWRTFIPGNANLLEIVDCNASGLTSMYCAFVSCSKLVSAKLSGTEDVTDFTAAFNSCSSLETVNAFDTSSCTKFTDTFSGCIKLKAVPLFDTSSATNMDRTFNGCKNVESGALALYEKVSSQTQTPSSHNDTFKNCGSNTVTGAAELAQIPASWGGTMS